MPIELSTPIAVISQDEFHDIDRVMLGHAFEIHNEFGRLLDEAVYKTELAERCQASGLKSQREVLIRVCHQHFSKDYFVDLLLAGSTVVEAKTAKVLTDVHHGQGINYLLLAGTHHGSLVNFRSMRVKREFLSTQLTHSKRTAFDVQTKDWPDEASHGRLVEAIQSFCKDVGLGLDVSLYREAFATLAGLVKRQLVPLDFRGRHIGNYEMHLLTEEVGLAVTALSDTQDYRTHLQRLLAMTRLTGIAWVNLRLGHILLTHLRRQNHGG